jgi:hypothetical protein
VRSAFCIVRQIWVLAPGVECCDLLPNVHVGILAVPGSLVVLYTHVLASLQRTRYLGRWNEQLYFSDKLF